MISFSVVEDIYINPSLISALFSSGLCIDRKNLGTSIKLKTNQEKFFSGNVIK